MTPKVETAVKPKTASKCPEARKRIEEGITYRLQRDTALPTP